MKKSGFLFRVIALAISIWFLQHSVHEARFNYQREVPFWEVLLPACWVLVFAQEVASKLFKAFSTDLRGLRMPSLLTLTWGIISKRQPDPLNSADKIWIAIESTNLIAALCTNIWIAIVTAKRLYDWGETTSAFFSWVQVFGCLLMAFGLFLILRRLLFSAS